MRYEFHYTTYENMANQMLRAWRGGLLDSFNLIEKLGPKGEIISIHPTGTIRDQHDSLDDARRACIAGAKRLHDKTPLSLIRRKIEVGASDGHNQWGAPCVYARYREALFQVETPFSHVLEFARARGLPMSREGMRLWITLRRTDRDMTDADWQACVRGLDVDLRACNIRTRRLVNEICVDDVRGEIDDEWLHAWA